ncbi:MAG: hypothetical protein J2P17_23715, partial [Mycobacterium sp.]|nr:hypothetical protein [Mycobacterium sp.]
WGNALAAWKPDVHRWHVVEVAALEHASLDQVVQNAAAVSPTDADLVGERLYRLGYATWRIDEIANSPFVLSVYLLRADGSGPQRIHSRHRARARCTRLSLYIGDNSSVTAGAMLVTNMSLTS